MSGNKGELVAKCAQSVLESVPAIKSLASKAESVFREGGNLALVVIKSRVAISLAAYQNGYIGFYP